MKTEAQIISEIIRARGDVKRLMNGAHRKKRPLLVEVITLLQQVEKEMWGVKFVDEDY